LTELAKVNKRQLTYQLFSVPEIKGCEQTR